jgi:pimeloyl-ACP methyl ester carboxylesterase
MKTVRSHDGTPIAFDQSGKGPAVILANGALSGRSAGAPLAALLAPHYTVFAYDRRGRGGSGDTAPYAVEREVDDLAAVLAAAGEPAFAFGHSSGAVLALEAARTLTFRKLALYEPPFVVDDSRPLPPDDYVARVAGLAAAGRRGDAVEFFMTRAVDVPAEMVAQMRNSPMWPAMEVMANTLAYDGAVMGDKLRGSPEPLQRWASVTVPTLVMDGGDSPVWARRAVQALVDVLPHAQRRTLPGQTHGAVPEALAPVLEEFFHE